MWTPLQLIPHQPLTHKPLFIPQSSSLSPISIIPSKTQSFVQIQATHHRYNGGSSSSSCSCSKRRSILLKAATKTTGLEEELPPNAVRRKREPLWRGGFSLGVDLGIARTGLALSKGFSIKPLTVLEMRGQKLDNRILDIAEQEEADEFIIGLPKSFDGKETPQSNIVRSVAGRLAIQAAERGWRVYLQDEHGTTTEAVDRMINMGLSKSSRQNKLDAYAAMMVLERYFSTSGEDAELVLPKNLELQGKLRKGPPKDADLFSDED